MGTIIQIISSTVSYNQLYLVLIRGMYLYKMAVFTLKQQEIRLM